MDDWDAVSSTAPEDSDTLAPPPASIPSRPSSRVGKIWGHPRYKRVGRDILALLSTALFVALEIYFSNFLADIMVFRMPFPLQIFINLLLLPYVAGIFFTIFAAAISGRKGFDVLFPVLIGYMVSMGGYLILSGDWQATYYGFYLFLLGSFLGAATYVGIRKIRARRKKA